MAQAKRHELQLHRSLNPATQSITYRIEISIPLWLWEADPQVRGTVGALGSTVARIDQVLTEITSSQIAQRGEPDDIPF